MNNNLQENFKLLVNYNPKLTLTENKKLNEDSIGKEITSLIAKDGKLVISDVAKNWLRELPSVNRKNFESFLLGFGGLSKESKQAFVKDLLTNTSSMRPEVMADATVAALINKASESLSKQLASNGTNLAKRFNALKNNPQKIQFLKKQGYRPDVINNILKDEKLVAKDFNSVSNKSKSPFLDDVGVESKSPFLDDVGVESKLSTDAEELIKNSKEEMKYYGQGFLDDIKRNNLVRKGLLKRVGGLGRKVKWVISKRKLAIWAAALYISISALKNWLSDNDIEVEETPPVENVGNIGGSITWSDCSTFPLTRGCKSDLVGEVQKCLGGLTVDNKFGPKTESKLKEKGYSTTVDQTVYNEIMKKCGQGNVSPTTTTTTTYKYEGKYAYNDELNN